MTWDVGTSNSASVCPTKGSRTGEIDIPSCLREVWRCDFLPFKTSHRKLNLNRRSELPKLIYKSNHYVKQCEGTFASILHPVLETSTVLFATGIRGTLQRFAPLLTDRYMVKAYIHPDLLPYCHRWASEDIILSSTQFLYTF